MSRGKTLMARPKKPAVRLHEPTGRGEVGLYTLEVFLISGPITDKFAKKNPVVSRTIQIRGDQTLEDLHHAIFDAFGRWDPTLVFVRAGAAGVSFVVRWPGGAPRPCWRRGASGRR